MVGNFSSFYTDASFGEHALHVRSKLGTASVRVRKLNYTVVRGQWAMVQFTSDVHEAQIGKQNFVHTRVTFYFIMLNFLGFLAYSTLNGFNSALFKLNTASMFISEKIKLLASIFLS